VVGGPPSSRQLVVAERAAAALAVGRLIEREHESLERQSHRTLLTAMVDQSMTSHELMLRSAALGVPLEHHAMVASVVRIGESSAGSAAAPALVRQLAETTATALRAARANGLVGVLDEVSVGLLLVAPDASAVESGLAATANRIRRNLADADLSAAVVAAGSTVNDVLDVRRSFLEATQVADLAGPSTHRPVHRLTDVGLSGLLHLLRSDERVQTYVERELGTVLAYDAANDTDLLGALRAYLESGRNKSTAASTFGLSRPAFYERLRSIEALLGIDLDDVSTCLTLHVAVEALDTVRETR
jgi:purine catabolism regulator